MPASGPLPESVSRIIDANTNRIGEGLRFLEEVARLVLNDTDLTRQLKELRHDLVKGDWAREQQSLQARAADADVGADMEVPGQARRDLPATVVANARRVQESLRVMEEVARLPGALLSSEQFKHARFSLYTIEKTLVSRLLRRDKLAKLPGLYVIIDLPSLQGRGHLEVAEQAIRGGASTIQLRDKARDLKRLLPIARELQTLCAGRGVLFIVNDYLDLAMAADADGLHVGVDDLPISEARRLLPIDKVLGASVFTAAQAATARDAGADYIAVGAVFPTPSKEIRVVGLARLRQVRRQVDRPLVAIGGINSDNVKEVKAAGADAVAVISAVLGAADVETAAREIVKRWQK